MTRFYADSRGRVIDRENHRYLGRVETVACLGDELHWPLSPDGKEIRRPTMLKSIAILAVIRAAMPREHVTLLDIEDGAVA